MARNGEAPALSVVVPVFNEAGNVSALVAELAPVLDRAAGIWEVLLVDDGSTDGSAEEIRRLAAADRRVRGIHFERNAGQTAAFDAGFRRARGEIIATMDADLQNDPADIPRLLEALEATGAAAVVGWRRERRDSLVRKVSSLIGNAVRNALSGDRIRDTGCSMKVFRARCLSGLKLYQGMHRFLPTLLRMEGHRVEEIAVGHRPRSRGVSKYGISNRAVRGLMDVLAVRWMKRRRLVYRIVEESGGPHGG